MYFPCKKNASLSLHSLRTRYWREIGMTATPLDDLQQTHGTMIFLCIHMLCTVALSLSLFLYLWVTGTTIHHKRSHHVSNDPCFLILLGVAKRHSSRVVCLWYNYVCFSSFVFVWYQWLCFRCCCWPVCVCVCCDLCVTVHVTERVLPPCYHDAIIRIRFLSSIHPSSFLLLLYPSPPSAASVL